METDKTTRERIKKAIEQEQERAKVISIETPDQRLKRLLGEINFEAYCQLDLPKPKTLLDPWLTMEQMVLIYAAPGRGKTMFGLGIAHAIANGEGFGPWAGNGEPVNVLYLDGELPAAMLKDRLINEMVLEPTMGKFRIYNDAYMVSQGCRPANLLDPQWRDILTGSMIEENIRVWFVDNLGCLSGGIDENSKKDYDPINQFFIELRKKGITTVFFHHTNKAGLQRGTSARADNVDIAMMLDEPAGYEPEQGCSFVVRFTKNRIATNKLDLLAPVSLSHGIHGWTWARVSKKDTALEMLKEGCTNQEIIEATGIHKGNLSRLRKKLQMKQ